MKETNECFKWHGT